MLGTLGVIVLLTWLRIHYELTNVRPSLIQHNAARLREMHARIHETFRLRPHGPEHEAACKEFREQYDPLAFPGGLTQALQRLRDHDISLLDGAIHFLREDPQYFRSGYNKEKILRLLKSFIPPPAQKNILGSLLIRSVQSGPRRMFMAYARLAFQLNSNTTTAVMSACSKSTDAEIRRRADHVLEVLKTHSSRVTDGVTTNAHKRPAILRPHKKRQG